MSLTKEKINQPFNHEGMFPASGYELSVLAKETSTDVEEVNIVSSMEELIVEEKIAGHELLNLSKAKSLKTLLCAALGDIHLTEDLTNLAIDELKTHIKYKVPAKALELNSEESLKKSLVIQNLKRNLQHIRSTKVRLNPERNKLKTIKKEPTKPLNHEYDNKTRANKF